MISEKKQTDLTHFTNMKLAEVLADLTSLKTIVFGPSEIIVSSA